MEIADIFSPEPTQWGLRGDKYLWRELKTRFSGIEMPEEPELLKRLLEREYEVATKYPINHKEHFAVERFKHGGMSSGHISPRFWVENGIPLLVSRHTRQR